MEVIDITTTGDRISGLPDSIVTHILSFLPTTEEAVRTCILSKRWIKVWASLPVLIFDDCTSRYDNLTEEEYQQREAKFLRFLGIVMLNREIITLLDTFKLTWCVNEWNTHILACSFLHSAVMCRPRVLSIHIDTSTVFNLPDSIFTCTSIEEISLWLETDDNIHVLKPRSINLPFLKNLELAYLDLNDDIMRMLISGCPVLKELALIYCWLELNIISCNVLNKLVLKYCNQRGGSMEISCPGVVSLSIIHKGGITLKNMSSLATADILFVEDDHPSNLELRLLSGLSNVTSLKLQTYYHDVMVLLLADIPNCPTFKNLKSLELGNLDFNYDWNLVACFLQHSSSLKDLILHFNRPREDATGEEFEGDFAFPYEYLEAVKISCPGKNFKLVEERDQGCFLTTAKIIIL